MVEDRPRLSAPSGPGRRLAASPARDATGLQERHSNSSRPGTLLANIGVESWQPVRRLIHCVHLARGSSNSSRNAEPNANVRTSSKPCAWSPP